MKKRILCIIIAICLCMICLPAKLAGAVHTSCELSRDGLWYYDFMESTILAYLGNEDHLIVPSTIDGHSMKYIDGGAFMDKTSLKTVEISKYIKEIGGSAFSGCTNLVSVKSEAAAVKLGGSVFNNCTSLETVEINITGEEIGSNTFKNCTSLRNFTIPENITTIKDHAFMGCTSLKTINLHKNITTLGEGVFYGCTSLDGIWVDSDHPKYANDAFGVLFNTDKTALIAAPGGLTGTYTAPDTVCVLSAEAFGGCSKLETIKLPDHIVDAGEGAFENCTSLKSIKIPTSLTTLRERLFQGCTALKSITLHKSVRYVKEGAFCGCSALGGIWVVSDNNWFSNDGSGVLFNKNRTTLVMAPGGLSGTYTVPSAVTTINAGAFANCKQLKTVLIPDKVTSIGKRCFENCTALHTVVLPYKAKISEEMLSGCTALDTFVFNQTNSTNNIAFKNCSSLASVYSLNGLGNYGSSLFTNVTADFYYLESEVSKTPNQTEAALCGGKLTWVPLQSYCVAKGDNSTYTIGSDIGAIFLMMADWNKLSTVSVDGQQLDSDQYLSMTNGTSIILKDEYLKTLPLGKHTLDVTYTDGSCTATFTLKEPCVHNTVKLPAVAPTCSQTGLTEGSSCTICGEIFAKQETVAVLGHNYSVTTQAPTCTESGYDLHRCTRCGKTTKANETAAMGHQFGDWQITKNPTVQATGAQVRQCEICGIREEKEIASLDPPVEQPTEPPIGQPTDPSVDPSDPTEPTTQPDGTQPSEPTETKPAPTEPTKSDQKDKQEQVNLVPWIIAGSGLLVLTAVGALYLLRKKS